MQANENNIHRVQERLLAYKKKYLLNQLLNGIFVTTAVLASMYLIFNTLEYYGRFSSQVRLLLLMSFVITGIILGGRKIVLPMLLWLRADTALSDKDAAGRLGSVYPEVRDKLINLIQLASGDAPKGSLLYAGLIQKSSEIVHINFPEAVRLQENKRWLPYFLPIALAAIGLALWIPGLFSESTGRIIRYNTTFATPAPFKFILKNENLNAYKNEDFELQLELAGEAIPENVYLLLNDRKYKMNSAKTGSYTYTLPRVQQSTELVFEAAGFNSDGYMLNLITRPVLRQFEIHTEPPAYTGLPAEHTENTGNLTVAEGTKVTWKLKAEAADNVEFDFSASGKFSAAVGGDWYLLQKRLTQSEEYLLRLSNPSAGNKDKISYQIEIIKDKYPEITPVAFQDTVLYKSIIAAGSIMDDYGFSKMRFYYEIIREGKDKTPQTGSRKVDIEPGRKIQNYYIEFLLDSLDLKPGDKVEYYTEVWDNDGIHGAKSTKSARLTMTVPSEKQISEELKKQSNEVESKAENVSRESEKINKEFEKLQNKLKTKDQLSWEDKKSIEELLKKQEKLEEQIRDMKDKNELMNERRERFGEKNEELAKKTEELQRLMDELLDEETKEMYRELQKLLEEKRSDSEIMEQMDKLQKKDLSMEKELERALELFKQLKTEQKLDDLKKEFEKLAEKQKELAQDNSKTDKEELKERQEEINSKFEELKKEMDEMQKMNESLKNPLDLEQEKLEKQEKEIEQKLQDSMKDIDKGNKKKSEQSQKDAGDKMQEMAQMMAGMQQEEKEKKQKENIEDLRQILDNLVKLSFEQEDLAKKFRAINQSNPEYLKLSQQQLELKDEAKIIEDSLTALAERVFQIRSFVTREMTLMNDYMEQSMHEIRERRPAQAAAKQQFAMTSMNNLALMLDEVLKQLRADLAAMPKGQPGGACNKPGESNKPKKPGMSELQQQLNQKMQDIKNGKIPGSQLSEELAKMARQQEMIRKQLQDMAGKLKKENGEKGEGEGGNEQGPGKQLEKLAKDMEKTEEDIVNKRITEQTLFRQKEIMTRLLEAEKSQRDRETAPERESKVGRDTPGKIPPSIEKYLKEKEKQTELLKTVNPAYTPYYKDKANEYLMDAVKE